MSLGVGVGMTPGVGNAVGFGKLSIESAIGEPLSVRVPLVSVQPGELEELGVSLAAPDWYSASGVEYPDIASELILNLDLSDPAEPAVTVTTVNGVDQVAIPIMLELEWPQRIMRRQVTVLLNPTGYQPQRTADVSSEPQLAGGGQGDGQSDGQFEASGTIGVASSASAVQPDLERGSQPATAIAQPLTDQAAAGQTVSAQAYSPADRPTVVTVESGDSLSTIVDRYLPDGANRFQGRMAFYDANSAAFRGGDINQIINGAELNVPAVSTILELPAAESRTRYAELIEAARVARSEQSQSDSSSGNQSTAAVDGVASDGFRLSLLEVEDPGLLEEQSSATEGSQSGSSAAQSGNLSQAGLGAEDFAMQGFSMKLTVMNAYIVELQDENRELKNRVATLEQKVEQLILRSRQPVSDLVADGGAVVGGSTDDNVADDTGGDRALVSETAQQATQEPADDDSAAEIVADGVNAEVVDSESDLAQTQLDQALEQALEQQPDTPASAESAADGAAQEVVTQEVIVVADSALANQVATAEGLGVETTSPRLVYREGLLQQAKQFVQRFNTPLVQLVVAVAALGLGLLLWMLFRDRKRYRLADEFREEEDSLLYDETVGVSYASDRDDEITQLDMDDDPWLSQSNMGEAELDNLPDSDVDLITQSEVYLTYNRPVQAVEVLLEEYSKHDSDKFVVATRILKIFEDMGQEEERNLLLRNFIVTLNGDIEEFTSAEWDALRHDLNALRRTEHLSAVGGDAQDLGTMDEQQPDGDDSSEQSVDQSLDDQGQARSDIEGFGTVESTNSSDNEPANDLKISRDDSGVDYAAPDREQDDDGVVELTYTSRDKAQSR